MTVDLFAATRPVIENTEPEHETHFIATEELLARFEALGSIFAGDCTRMEPALDILFDEDVTGYGAKVTALFDEWDAQPQGGPSLTAQVACVMPRLGVAPDSDTGKAVFVAAILGEYPNNLQYHGNEHYRKVFFHTVRLIAKHNDLFAGTERALSQKDIAKLLIAACVHDLGHEGGDNMKEGMYTPGLMEQRSFNIARPYLEACDMDYDDMGEIETIIFSTDITFLAGDKSPCLRMKQLYRYYFWGEDVGDASMMMMGKLRRYEDNPQLVFMAMLLHEADVGSSAGLSYAQTRLETVNIMEERGLKNAGPAVVLAFLREQLGETMYTEAAKQVFGPAMDEVIHHAEADVENGVTSFYS